MEKSIKWKKRIGKTSLVCTAIPGLWAAKNTTTTTITTIEDTFGSDLKRRVSYYVLLR
jgi:hypothetical protein